jgi:hypothetical protein
MHCIKRKGLVGVVDGSGRIVASQFIEREGGMVEDTLDG